MKKWAVRILATILVVIFAGSLLLRTQDIDGGTLSNKYSYPHSHFLIMPEAKVHYTDRGPKDAEVLLFIHGSNSSLHTWSAASDFLKEKYRIVAIDLPGHGITGSVADRDYSAHANIKIINRVLDKLGIKRAVWVGNSMGGWIAWRGALATPERVSKLVLVDASGAQTNEPMKPYIGAKLAANPIGRIFLTSITPKFLVAKSLEQSIADKSKLNDELVTRYWELLHYPGNRQAVIDRASTSREEQMWEKVGQIKAPTLIIWGDKDMVIPLSHSKAFNEKISGSSLIVMANNGHLPMEESPAEFARHLDGWLSNSIIK